MNALDWVILVLVAMYALSGYWQGFVTGSFATLGLVLGGLVGIWLAPRLLGKVGPSVWVSIGAVLVMVICASLGQAALQLLGAKLRDSITWQPIRAVDAVGGALLSPLAVLLVVWVLASAVSGSQLTRLGTLVRGSLILDIVDSTMPDSADTLVRSFNNVVASSPFPRYLEPFAPERIVPADPGPERMITDREVLASEKSVLKIHGVNRCDRGVEGTGFLYADDRLMTNAHVVAGVNAPEVLMPNGEIETATVVFFDPGLDIAVLAFDDQGREPLQFAGDAKVGQGLAIVGYPEDGPFTVETARVRSLQQLRSPNIYGESSVVRSVISLRGQVLPGNSGGPVLNGQGRVSGVIFAASISDTDTGYALSAASVQEAAEAGIAADAPVSTQRCA